MKIATVNVGNKMFAMVPVSEMEIDKAYQRVASSRVGKMSAEWDYDKCDALLVSYRNDKYYVVDGQHRYIAAKANSVDYLPCQVLFGMTQADEARKFVETNTLICKLSPFDTFNANVILSDKVDTIIKDLTSYYGIKISGNNGITVGQLGSITIARSIVRKNGKDCLDWILNVLHEAKWNEHKTGHSERVFHMLRSFYAEHESNIYRYDPMVIDTLYNTTPVLLASKAKATFPMVDLRVACSKYLEYIVTGSPKAVAHVA